MAKGSMSSDSNNWMFLVIAMVVVVVLVVIGVWLFVRYDYNNRLQAAAKDGKLREYLGQYNSSSGAAYTHTITLPNGSTAAVPSTTGVVGDMAIVYVLDAAGDVPATMHVFGPKTSSATTPWGAGKEVQALA